MTEALKPESDLKERFTFHHLKAKGVSDHAKKNLAATATRRCKRCTTERQTCKSPPAKNE